MTTTTLAIDFGTTNTYVSLCAADNTNVEGIKFDGTHPEMPTEILYSDKPDADKNVFPIIGKRAAETYTEWDTDERVENQCRYRAIFKPDIVKSADAKKCAVDFLKSLLRDAKKNNTPLNPLDCRVFFGVPAEAKEEYRSMLTQIANEAGFGSVELVEEPKGAMFSDLGHGTLFSFENMLQGYFVIDFGGGTCDFAFFQNGVIKHSWGDMHLGGRLLDDLFWQWFSEENPDTAEKLIQTGEDFYFRTVNCRELKEWFSNTITGNPDYNGKKKVGDTEIFFPNPVNLVEKFLTGFTELTGWSFGWGNLFVMC
ncbi:hypothetical protein FACS1894189_2580 [Planctomycetales bacterium]|nr:hypothetical protein FACS1894189_2580 [Planctomycetales bacterium]